MDPVGKNEDNLFEKRSFLKKNSELFLRKDLSLMGSLGLYHFFNFK